MPKKIACLLLSSLFLVFLIAPTIIIIIDQSIDISTFYTSSKKEKKESEENQKSEVLFFELNPAYLDFSNLEVEKNTEHYFKNYAKPYLNLILLPPEFYNIII